MTPARALGRGVLLLLVCSAGLPGRAGGRLEPPELDRYLRWGPLRARPGIELSNLGYDDNILATTDAPISDYTATVSPRLEGLLLFGSRAFLTFNEGLKLVGYLQNENQSYVDQIGSGRLTVPFGHVGLFGDVRLDRTKQPPLDLEDARAVRTVGEAGFGFIARPGGRTEIEIGRKATSYRYEDPDFASTDADLNALLGRSEQRTTLEADYRLVGRTKLTLDAARGLIEFDERDSLGRDRDSIGYSVYPGLDFGEHGALSGSVRLGIVSIDARDSGLVDFRGLAGEAHLAYRPLRRGTLRLDWRRRPGFAVFQDATYLLDQSVEVGLLYWLAWPVGLESSVRLATVTFPAGGPDRVDRVREYRLGTRLRLAQSADGRRIEYRFEVRYYDVDSNVDSLDRDRFSGGFGAALGY